MSKAKHSLFGGSSAWRLVNCPASAHILKENPLPQSKYADQGIDFHSMICQALDGRVVDCDEDTQNLIDIVLEIIKPFKGTEGAMMRVEQQIPFARLHKEAFGTPDILVYQDFGPLHVFDTKRGWDFVPAEGNEQCMYYALAGIDHYNLEPSEIHLHIIQPMHKEPHRHSQVMMSDLEKFFKKLKDAVKRTIEAPGQYCPGAWCLYCNKTACGHFQKNVELETSIELTAPEVKEVNITNLPTERLLKIRKWAPLLQKMIKEADAQLFERAMLGEKIAGCKLVKAVGNRAWKEDLDEGKLARDLGIATEKLYEQKFLSPTKIEKALKDKLKDEKYRKIFDAQIERREKGAALVSEEAKGEPWIPGEFTDVE